MLIQRTLIINFLLTAVIFSCSTSSEKKLDQARSLRVKDDVKSLAAALKKYDEVIELTSLALDGKADAHKALGIRLSDEAKFLAAAAEFQKALAILPADANLYYYQGLCYANHAKVLSGAADKKCYAALAEESYKTGLNIDARNSALMYAYGVLEGFVRAKPSAGLLWLEKSILADASNTDALSAAANLHYKMGHKERAVEYYNNVRQLSDEKSTAYIKAGENLRRIREKQ